VGLRIVIVLLRGREIALEVLEEIAEYAGSNRLLGREDSAAAIAMCCGGWYGGGCGGWYAATGGGAAGRTGGAGGSRRGWGAGVKLSPSSASNSAARELRVGAEDG